MADLRLLAALGRVVMLDEELALWAMFLLLKKKQNDTRKRQRLRMRQQLLRRREASAAFRRVRELQHGDQQHMVVPAACFVIHAIMTAISSATVVLWP